jgi:hypothetical protein
MPKAGDEKPVNPPPSTPPKTYKPSPKFPSVITRIPHSGGGSVRTNVEEPPLREPGHGGGSVRPPKQDGPE